MDCVGVAKTGLRTQGRCDRVIQTEHDAKIGSTDWPSHSHSPLSYAYDRLHL